MYRTLFLIAIIAGTLSANASPGARLLRQPDISREKIAFIYAGDLWTVPRTGGAARRLTATAEAESFPKFSPDGNSIAFNRHGDIYVIPATGGDERRLTWHPGGRHFGRFLLAQTKPCLPLVSWRRLET